MEMSWACFLVIVLLVGIKGSDNDVFVPTRIFTVHCISRNIGDEFSTPVKHFPSLADTTTAQFDIWWSAPKLIARYDISKSDMVIIGGGGLLRHNEIWSAHILEYCLKATCIIWAPGYNQHFGYTQKEQVHVDIMQNAYAIALRDYFENPPAFEYERMFDTSCFLRDFDEPCDPSKRNGATGAYLHGSLLAGQFTQSLLSQLTRSDDILLNNCTNITQVIEFLCGYDTIITSSYHGLLWATYLNKATYVVNAFSEKFLNLPFSVSLFAPESDGQRLRALPLVNGTGLRNECKQSNINFYNKYILPGVTAIQKHMTLTEEINQNPSSRSRERKSGVHNYRDCSAVAHEMMSTTIALNTPLFTVSQYQNETTCFHNLAGKEATLVIHFSHA
jgi:hypothetical protein